VAAGLEFRVLGPVRVLKDGVTLPLGGRMQRAVLARLLMARREPVSAERIIDDLWSGAPPPSAVGVLQAHVSTLRRALEPDRPARAAASVLVRQAPGYALLAETDAEVFGRLVERGMAGAGPEAESALESGMALWRGDPYADLADEPWLAAEISRLQELRVVALEHRFELVVADSRAAASAVPELQSLVARYPLREGLWRSLALALYRTGRQAEALFALRRARDTLVEELGIDPSSALRDLEVAVLAQDQRLLTPSTDAASSAARSARRVEVRAGPPLTATDGADAGRPLLGRDEIMTVIADLATEASSGQPRVMVISGEPGIGKTRVAEAAHEVLDRAGWSTVWGRCHEASGAPALWPWLQVLHGLSQQRPPPPELATLLADTEPSAAAQVQGDAADARFRQRMAVARYLAALSEDEPLLVVLDDLQWADAASLGLLVELPELARTGRLLLLCTARTDPAAQALTDALARLSRLGAVHTTLRGLDESAVAAMISTYRLDADARQLTRRTGGNPLLLRGILRALARDPNSVGPRVPETVADLVRERLTALDASVRTVLQAAAAIGRHVDVDLLQRAVDCPAETVFDAVDAAAQAGILTERPTGALEFTHDLVVETLYQDVPPLRRARMHERLLRALGERGAADVTQLAVHAVAAAPVGVDATEPAAAAARQAYQRLGYDDAVRWWRQALQAHEAHRREPRRRVDLLLGLVRAQLAAGDAIGALETRDEAVLASEEVADPRIQAAALVAVDTPSLWALRGYSQLDIDLVGRLARARETPGLDDHLRCRLLATLANEMNYGADELAPRKVAAEALALARKDGDPVLLTLALHSVYLADRVDPSSWPRNAEPVAAELLDLDLRHGLPGYALLGRLILEQAAVIRYDLPRADRHATETEQHLARLRQPLPAVQHRFWRMKRHLLAGRFAEAELLLDEQAAAELPWWRFQPLLQAARLAVLWHSGRMAEIGPLLPAVGSVHPAAARDAELLMLITAGEHGRARDLARDAPTPGIPRDWMWAFAQCLRAAAVAACGGAEDQRAAYDRLYPHRRLIATTGTSEGGPVDYYLALLAAALGEPTSAAQHLADLHRLAHAAGLEHWARRARHMLDHGPALPHQLPS
jgi:DNA-binding SARP family transcriptional activator